jgi:hypothetical protein
MILLIILTSLTECYYELQNYCIALVIRKIYFLTSIKKSASFFIRLRS